MTARTIIFPERVMDKESTAYHEAGHAVVAWVLGGDLIEVTIEPSEPDEMDPGCSDSLGSCLYFDTEDNESNVKICLAGALAAKAALFCGWRSGASGDYAYAWNLIDEYVRCTSDLYDEADKDEWRRLEKQTSKLIAEHWHLIEALALELLGRSLLGAGTLTGHQAHALFVQQIQIRYLLG